MNVLHRSIRPPYLARSIATTTLAEVALLVFFILVSMATAQTVRTNSLESMRTICSTAVDRIATDTTRQENDARAQYGKALEATLASLKQKGDITSYRDVDVEAKQFRGAGLIPTNSPNPYVATAAAAYQKQLLDIETESNGRMVNLLKQYVAALNTLVKDLMAKDKIDDATVAGNVKRDAETALAALESKMPGNSAKQPNRGADVAQSGTVSKTSDTSAHAIMLQAKKVQTKEDAVKKTEEASLNIRHDAVNPGVTWYSHPQLVDVIYGSQTVEVSVRNTGKDADRCVLRVVFFVENLETGAKDVQDVHDEELELPAGNLVTKSLTSPKTRYSKQKMMLEGEEKKIGSKPYGYLVVLADTSGPFKWSGSVEVSRLLRTAADISTLLKDKKLK